MKKRIYLIILCICLVGAFIFSYLYVTKNKERMDAKIAKLKQEKESSYPAIYDSLDSVTVDNFQSALNEKELVIYVGRPTCSDCNLFEPALVDLINQKKLNAKMKYLNVAKLKENEEEWSAFKQLYTIQYTPTIAKFIDGKLVSKVEWTPEAGISIEEVAEWFDQYVL